MSKKIMSKRFWRAVEIISIIAFIILAILLVQTLYARFSTNSSESKMQELFGAQAEEMMLEEFNSAYEANPEVVGMLKAGASIQLFVPQGEDNAYYLDHDFFGKSINSGAAFADCRCDTSTSSKYIMIHGHNMRSGAVFGTLDDFRDIGYLRKYPLVTYDLLTEARTYVPFAAFDISTIEGDRHYFPIDTFEFESDAELAEFQSAIKGISLFDIPVDVNADDTMLALVTCSYSYDNGRFILVCRAMRDGETEEEMAELVKSSTKR